MKDWRGVVGAVTVALWMAPLQASAQLADSYPDAEQLGQLDEADPQTQEYHRNVLLPEFGTRYRKWLKECQASLPEHDKTPYSFVAAIGADGTVQRMWSDRAAPVFSCLRGHLMFERFAPPPRAPFYLLIRVRFSQ